MKQINILITIAPLNAPTSAIELSKANEKANEILSKVTETISQIDTSRFSFNFDIITK